MPLNEENVGGSEMGAEGKRKERYVSQLGG